MAKDRRRPAGGAREAAESRLREARRGARVLVAGTKGPERFVACRDDASGFFSMGRPWAVRDVCSPLRHASLPPRGYDPRLHHTLTPAIAVQRKMSFAKSGSRLGYQINVCRKWNWVGTRRGMGILQMPFTLLRPLHGRRDVVCPARMELANTGSLRRFFTRYVR
jgi:hypothetical protein